MNTLRPMARYPVTWVWLAAALAAVLAMYLLAYRGILFTPGYINQNWDQTFPPFPSEIRAYGNFSAWTWLSSYELGTPSPMTGISRYFDLIVREGLAWLGGGFLARWLNLAYALTGATGFWLLGRSLGLGGPACLVVCLISQFNPRTYSVAINGHTENGLAFALIPFALLWLDKAVRAPNKRVFLASCLGSAAVTALACSSAIGITISLALLVLYCLAALMAKRSAKPVWALGLILGVTLVLHLHWILPTVSGSAGSASFKYNEKLEDIQTEYLNRYREYSVAPRQAMIGHTDNMGMGTEYVYPVQAPRDQWWKPSAMALLGLALLGLLCQTPSRSLKWFAAFSLLVGFWLLTGAKTVPGSIIYELILARVKLVFFFMARPARWLLVYYTGLALLAGLGLEAARRRGIWVNHRWPDKLALVLTALILATYLWPWWSGQLTQPKNQTTQTLALMPQTLAPEEEQLVGALNRDPGLYRVTVFPTITSPTGNVPWPPSSSLTRNFGILGKDSFVGPAFVGQPFGRFLLSLAHGLAPATDHYGRLLGLGAVKRVIWDVDQPYLSYMDFGWMPQTKRGSETLSDPRGVLTPFLLAQEDLKADPQWSFGPFRGLDNTDALARLRLVNSAGLAAGGFPLLASLAELPDNVFARQALFMSTDVDQKDLESLGRLRGGLWVGHGCGPELLLPFLPASCWYSAKSYGQADPKAWKPLGERWHQASWFEGSPLDGGALQSQSQTSLRIPLPDQGPYRLLARVANLPGQHGLNLAIGSLAIASTPTSDPFDRGWRWLDLGWRGPGANEVLTVTATGYGAVVSGVLAVPRELYDRAKARLDKLFPPEKGTTAVAAAAACAVKSRSLYGPVQNFPLLASLPGITPNIEGLRLKDLDGCGVGSLIAEGPVAGQAVYRLDFPRPVAGFTLVSYPRLFGDPQGMAYVKAQWSTDGVNFKPLYQLAGATDGKWENIYERREEQSVQVETGKLWLRFELRQAQLVSQGNPPNLPMSLRVTPAAPFPGAPSSGQAVLLPAEFAPITPRGGPQRVTARLLTPQGPIWRDLGTFQPDPNGVCRLSLNRAGLPGEDGPGGDDQTPDLACDLLVLSNQAQAAPRANPPKIEASRLNPARYLCQGLPPEGGVLLFSESYHPAWQAKLAGLTLSPLKAYGFMNAYVLPENTPDRLQLAFKPQDYRDLGLKISLGGWIGLVAALLALWAWGLGRENPGVPEPERLNPPV